MAADISDPPPASTSRHDPEAHPAEAAPDPTGRRKFMRTNVELPVQFLHTESPRQGLTENLSPGGVFVRSDWSCEVGQVVHLTIRLPNASRITAHGIVRWVRPSKPENPKPGMGIEFTELDGGGPTAPHR